MIEKSFDEQFVDDLAKAMNHLANAYDTLKYLQRSQDRLPQYYEDLNCMEKPLKELKDNLEFFHSDFRECLEMMERLI